MNVLLAFLFLIQQSPDSLQSDTTKVIEVVRPAPPTDVIAMDTPNDEGESIALQWTISKDDGDGLNSVILYNVFRAPSKEGPFDYIGTVGAGRTGYDDQDVEKDKVTYYYKVKSQTKDKVESEASNVASAQSFPQWFHHGRWNYLIFGVLFTFFFAFYLSRAKVKGTKLFIRKIAGLDAVEEAVGRSTEMGKPVLFCPGIGYLYHIATIAALTILGKIAKKTAEYETRLIMPNYDPLVMTAAQEIVKQSYTEAGRPDNFNEKDIFYLTQDQFGFAAGVDGIMIREKPGAIFLQGVFYAESLILAETGHSVGAIQIAGTDRVTQLPFFISACDYTLIGEEMFAASSYLSRDPVMLGTIKGEDTSKVVIIAVIIIGTIMGILGGLNIGPFGTWFLNLVNWFTRG
ncbi:hypothetical protein KAX75_11900 [candidate division WOR-3 bacterium]|nr:hypothetical protein [candidate division WOR-3 bacterium]